MFFSIFSVFHSAGFVGGASLNMNFCLEEADLLKSTNVSKSFFFYIFTHVSIYLIEAEETRALQIQSVVSINLKCSFSNTVLTYVLIHTFYAFLFCLSFYCEYFYPYFFSFCPSL